MPNTPAPRQPEANWEHYQVWTAIKDQLASIPQHFRSTISVSGIRATEVFTFGPVLGVTIEEEVVRTLNDLRGEWDPGNHYDKFGFVRQTETFPDVLFANLSTREIAFGIELKSWYLVAKEGEPSFRFKISQNACAVADLLMVVPWALSNVLSGAPIVYKPWVASARWVAEYRNYWWQESRRSRSDSEIRIPETAQPYPTGRETVADEPSSDQGSNFGRIARIGIMDDWIKELRNISLIGIRADKWREFFKNGATSGQGTVVE